MQKRDRPEKRSQSFRRQWEALTSKVRSVSLAYDANVFLLVLRAGRWHSEVRRQGPTGDENVNRAQRMDARRLKEGFRRQREALVARCHRISASCRANVFILITRKGRWYAEDYVHVSLPHRHGEGASLTELGTDDDRIEVANRRASPLHAQRPHLRSSEFAVGRLEGGCSS